MKLENLKKIMIESLKKAHEVHNLLGSEGEEEISKNQYAETALRVDLEVEKAIIDYLKELRMPAKIISEEYGTVSLHDNPRYLVIIDGLDGSEVYRQSRGKRRYGTMIGVFSNINPKYNDYLFSGIVEHSSGRFFFAKKGEGSYVIDGEKTEMINCSRSIKLHQGTKIYIDEYWEINRKVFSSKLREFNTRCRGSSAINYIDLACGESNLVLECTRKGNLEIAISYGLIKEATGVIVTLDGESIGEKSYFEFGQKENLPVVSGGTLELAKELIDKVKDR